MAAPPLPLTRQARHIAGILLLSLTAVEFGGGEEVTEFQQNFARAGHAHAGVLVSLALIILVLVDAADLRGAWGYAARLGVPSAAVLMPAGFFLSSSSAGATEPNGLVALVWLGALCLAAGVVSAGLGLLRRPAVTSDAAERFASGSR